MDFPDMLDFFFPNHCLGCGAEQNRGRVLCKRCEVRIPINKTFFCGQCHEPLAHAEQQCHDNAPYLLGSAGSYTHPLLRDLLHRFKFDGIHEAVLPLGRLLIRYLTKMHFELGAPLIVPIPLHEKREWFRGFNQSAIVATMLADYFGYEYSDRVLVRTQSRPPQSSLTHEEREENIRGCFAATSHLSIHDRTIVLVDDVVTSGSTLEEAARTLRAHGVRSVIALTILKA